MEKHACKLCHRQFSNGRALGGHMRSHVVAAAAAATKTLLPDDDSSSSTSSREAEETEVMSEEGKGLGYDLRENPKKSCRMADPEFSSIFGGSSVVQDLESETESFPRPSVINRRRPKLPRLSAAPPPPPEVHDPEPLSSVSDTTPEEDVALSLMMLSRDVWTKEDEEAELQNLDLYAEVEIEDRVELSEKPRKSTASGRSRFQCGACKKVFRSYQALGGHRASHKKSRGCAPQGKPSELQIQDVDSSEANAKEKTVHECPICFRVFGSGQAPRWTQKISPFLLFSHHYHRRLPAVPSILAKLEDSMFDLNLPAPMDDNGEQSAVSNSQSPPQQL
ncbi:hypothetical protein HPP92_014050 [Vanilla planifolia]|uniref:C2H2-type domain-containing protein n=1 Tax=Vanilla planifolia TaxID=51239 RepID=A0A835QKN3_VANPL|nr:hypothetical protein HPP92_014050 [Vanilla planifolia]